MRASRVVLGGGERFKVEFVCSFCSFPFLYCHDTRTHTITHAHLQAMKADPRGFPLRFVVVVVVCFFFSPSQRLSSPRQVPDVRVVTSWWMVEQRQAGLEAQHGNSSWSGCNAGGLCVRGVATE